MFTAKIHKTVGGVCYISGFDSYDEAVVYAGRYAREYGIEHTDITVEWT